MKKPRKRTKVREVFDRIVRVDLVENLRWFPLTYLSNAFKTGDRVQVVVTLLERKPK